MYRVYRPILATLLPLLLLTAPQAVRAQVIGPTIVHDPLNELQFLKQISNQVTQINQFAAQIQSAKTNLLSYSNMGQWTQLQTRLQNLQQLVQQQKNLGHL